MQGKWNGQRLVIWKRSFRSLCLLTPSTTWTFMEMTRFETGQFWLLARTNCFIISFNNIVSHLFGLKMQRESIADWLTAAWQSVDSLTLPLALFYQRQLWHIIILLKIVSFLRTCVIDQMTVFSVITWRIFSMKQSIMMPSINVPW